MIVTITRENKIAESKNLREYTQQRYGVCSGLKESIDFIEGLQANQTISLTREDRISLTREDRIAIKNFICGTVGVSLTLNENQELERLLNL